MRRTVRRLAAMTLVAGVIVAAMIVRPWSLLDDEPVPPVAAETSAVRVQTLAEEHSAEGSLTYREAMSAYATPDGRTDGSVLTAVIGADTPVANGSVLWRIGLEPTVLLIGSTPSHRDLAIGDTGVDVLQLELNLVTLGFDPDSTVTVDDTYTYYTSLMVERWQEANEATVTGEVAQGSVVYAPADRRVGAVHLGVGDVVSDGDPVLELTGLGREVEAVVGAGERSTVDVGDPLTVTLPDRSELLATVSSIVIDETGAAVVTAEVDGDVDLLAGSVPVTVEWSTELARDVVTVPESALLRVDSGTYYVELAAGTLVEVQPGASSGGWVQVNGQVAVDDQVVAP